MTAGAYQDFRAGAVVGHEEDERVLENAHLLELINQAPDLTVGPVDHGRVDCHLRGLEPLLLVCEPVPTDGVFDFARPVLRAKRIVVARRPQFGLAVGQCAVHDAHFFQPLPAPLAHYVPALVIAVQVLVDIRLLGLHGEMRGCVSHVMEERCSSVIILMVAQAFKCVIGDGGCRELLPVIRIEEVFPLLDIEAPADVKLAFLLRIPRVVHVPLAGVVAAIAGLAQVVRDQALPLRPRAGRRIHADLRGVVTGQDGRTCGPASAGIVEVGEPDAVRREAVEIRRLDLAAVAARVRKAHVIHQYEHHVRPAAGEGVVGAVLGHCDFFCSAIPGHSVGAALHAAPPILVPRIPRDLLIHQYTLSEARAGQHLILHM